MSQGAGLRAQSGERTGYAHTDDLALPNLEEAARQARAIADGAGESAVVPVTGGARPHDLYTLAEPPIAAESSARSSSSSRWTPPRAPRIRGCEQVIASLGSEDVVDADRGTARAGPWATSGRSRG